MMPSFFIVTRAAFLPHPPPSPSSIRVRYTSAHPCVIITKRPGRRSTRTKSIARSLRCRSSLPDRLPSEAYTTLSVDETPVCRLITSLRSSSASSSSSSPSSASFSGSSLWNGDRQTSTRILADLVDAGFRTVDLPTDTDSGSIEPFREYLRLVGPSTARLLHLCTRVSVHPHTLRRVHRPSVEALVDAELARTGAEQIHLFQLAWHDLRDGRYVDFLGELQELKKGGKIRSVGTIDFPTIHLQHLASQRISIASNTVSFSLVDSRAKRQMAPSSHAMRVALLATHSVAAGFIHERFIGLPEPSKRACSSPDLVRLAAIIRLWGGWPLFQELLYSVKRIADKYEVSMPNIAIKWALQQPAFSSVVVDAGLGDQTDFNTCLDAMNAFQFSLDEDDNAMLDAVLKKGNDLHQIIGDCGDEYQPREAPPSPPIV